MKIAIKSIRLENFKGCANRTIEFGTRTKIRGANATGKTTIFDGFTWLLFNKNSAGEEKFNVRPLDKDGNRVDNVEIKIVATLDIEGKEVTLSKVQKQKWVKKRGTDVTELQGNENLYEVGGYPKSESDYKDYIASIMNEDLFKMITSPYFFTAMKWQDQRNILMQFVTEMSDLEMAQKNPKFADLLTDLENAPSTDDIKKKYQKALSTYKDRQKELPARIDEVSKMKADVDVAELELAKNSLVEKITDVYEKIKSGSKVIDDLEQQKFDLKFEINNCKRKANETLIKQKREIADRQFDATNKFNDLHQKISIAERGIAEKKIKINDLENQKPQIREDFQKKNEEQFDKTPYLFDESAWVFDENSTVCSMCHQPLPEAEIERMKSDFESRKSEARETAENRMNIERDQFNKQRNADAKRLSDKGKQLVSDIAELEKEVSDAEKNLPEWKSQEIEAMKIKNQCSEELSKLPAEADLSQNEEYLTLMKKDSDFDTQIASAKEIGVDTSALEAEKAGYETELENVKDEIAKSAKNVEIDERITELENEQKEVGQKVADQEKMLYLLEEFIREKMNVISKSINDKFKTVEWKLFEMQLNGGMKECCECTVNGVPYSTLNSGHRIVAGLDIIAGLSELKGVVAPIFVDNSEAVNDFNIPDMDAQMILLEVTADKELKVEVE